jgi:hypothetical protein
MYNMLNFLHLGFFSNLCSNLLVPKETLNGGFTDLVCLRKCDSNFLYKIISKSFVYQDCTYKICNFKLIDPTVFNIWLWDCVWHFWDTFMSESHFLWYMNKVIAILQINCKPYFHIPCYFQIFPVFLMLCFTDVSTGWILKICLKILRAPVHVIKLFEMIK